MIEAECGFATGLDMTWGHVCTLAKSQEPWSSFVVVAGTAPMEKAMSYANVLQLDP